MDKIDKLIQDLGLDKHIPYEIQQDEIMLGIFKKGLESIMQGELAIKLGYGNGDRTAKNTANKRNGSYSRKLDTSAGRIEDLAVPRDRNGEFQTKLFGERETKMDRVEQLIIGMYAKGTSTKDISDLLNSLYNFTLNRQTVSNVVKQINDEFKGWIKRPLLTEYAFLFIDALHQKIRRDTVDNEAIYVVVGVTMAGQREFIGLYNLGAAESSSSWPKLNRNTSRS
ncbi:transposase [Candidatus Methanoperedens nitroreducens]|uniref:Transposase n=1 Tax=Candidatus Methanoperedens nitratireducens TaxID=1392998 RepID=A0A062V1M6_9EURY|nr:IS256 family transposase [Candidatus Methanoperedens nitroreducens]KCZ71277.1 transposase [Candidatus Methanoperedens nitroreducens]MDJ1420297.1 IS256 family transposase [Candidatus Methanoperedens sp.]